MPGARFREAKAAIAALLAHAAFLLVAATRPPTAPNAGVFRPRTELDAIEVESVRLRETPSPPAAPAGEQSAPATGPQIAGTRTSAPPITIRGNARAQPHDADAPDLVAEGDVPSVPPGAPPADEGYSPTVPSPFTLPPGLGGAPLSVRPGMVPDAAPPKPAATVVGPQRPVDPDAAGQALRGSLRKKDSDSGLEIPGAGVAASVLADAVRSSAIPSDARATFEVQLGAKGNVEGVRLMRSSAGDAATWAKVTADATRSLASRTLQMNGDARGATVVVKIESNVQFPAGSKQKLESQAVCANEVIEQIEAALRDPNKVEFRRDTEARVGFIADTGMTDDQRRRVCIPIGIRGKGDLSNIAAHATQVVRSSFTVRRAGEMALTATEVLPVDTRVPWAGRSDPTKVKPPPPPKKKKKKPSPPPR